MTLRNDQDPPLTRGKTEAKSNTNVLFFFFYLFKSLHIEDRLPSGIVIYQIL